MSQDAMGQNAERPYPVKPGDWVRNKHDGKVATVKAVYRDGMDGRDEVLADLVVYDRRGNRVGRESPAMGGPRSFEPACTITGDWERIGKPRFPIELKWIPNEDGTKTAGYYSGPALPDRAWLPPRRGPRALPQPPAVPPKPEANFDPAMEAAARRLAAQELRDAARQTGVAALAERAAALEAEADRLAPRF